MIPATAMTLTLMALGQVVLPGSRLEPRDAYAEAHTVVVAEVAKTGLLFGSGPHWVASGLVLEPKVALKGDARPAAPMSGLSMQGGGAESLPGMGQEYVFFVGEHRGHPQILKVLARTDENLAALRAPGD